MLINSYHQGYAWTDSLTSGIIDEFKLHPDYNLNIESLNSKQFGKSNFEIEKNYILSKYRGIPLGGVIVTDNDALDFAIQYQKELFPEIPVVFAGISNPEDYALEGTLFYGFKESGSTESVIGFVRNLLPMAKHLLIITDETTTGMIYRKEFTKQALEYDNFSVQFPKDIDLNSIYQMVNSKKDFDAIYYTGLSMDENGKLIDFIAVVTKICHLAKVPVFINDPLFNGKGAAGGMFQNGTTHGSETVKLLVRLINTAMRDSIAHINTTKQGYFFDQELLDKFNISLSGLPEGSKIINRKPPFNKAYFGALLSILGVLALIIVVLTVLNRKRKVEHKKSKNQLHEIEARKSELEEAHHQLSQVIAELENANEQLNESNINLTEAKKKAEESDNLKSAFLANVSHEIRTPLNSIVGFSSLLSESGLDEETRNSYIDLIESNTESLLVLIDEIIDLSKIEAQQLTIRKQDFSIDVLLRELVQIFNHGHKNSEIELRMSKISDEKELFVFSDRVRVKQVFINLLSNAFKFTDRGYIEFGYFELEHDKIQLFVRDTGIGIKEEHQNIIFDRFRKLNTEGNKVYRGTGLGLSITKKLVELLGGQISIHSTPGEGTVFFFTVDGLDLKDTTK